MVQTNGLQRTLADIPVFRDEDADALRLELVGCKTMSFNAGEYICNEGEYDHNCLILLSGRAKVLRTGTAVGRSEKIIGEGEIFGEIAALSGNPRTADIQAQVPTDVLSIPREKMYNILDKFPSVKNRIDQIYRERTLRGHLLKIPIFSSVPEDFLEELAGRAILRTYLKDESVFEQDDDADSFYLIRYGFVKVRQRGEDGRVKVLAYLKEGSYFGEMGLFSEHEKRSASVSAINRAELIKIPKDAFQSLIEAHPEVKRYLQRAADKRREWGEQLEGDEYLASILRSTVETGIIQTKAALIIDLSRCVHCDNCIEACAALHDGRSLLVRKGSMLNNFNLLPTSCMHCDDPTCMTNCPTGAITRDINGEIYHKDSCIGCGSCAQNCPFGNIVIVDIHEDDRKPGLISWFSGLLGLNGKSSKEPVENEKTGAAGNKRAAVRKQKPRKKAYKCDMCRNHVYMGCVYNCPTGAARRVNPAKFFTEIASAL